MTQKIAHRGPDAEAFFVKGNVSLGFRRLAIIDLVTGDQPITYGPFTLVFNGEIYNYKELRRELEQKGHAFKTTSDTEVLLHMLAEYGPTGLPRLSGMFALALWNEDTQELLLARDHLGIKPLFWGEWEGTYIFGSEIKALLAHPSVKRNLNTSVLNSYFQYRYIVGEETLFAGIKSLPPGSYVFLRSGTAPTVERYWSLPTVPKTEDLGEEFYVTQTHELLTRAVQKMMQADVPVGAYLSGGLDSSIVVALMASLRKGSKDLHTFGFGFSADAQNELEEARLVSEQGHTKHHEVLMTPEEYFNSIEGLIRYKDAPLSVPNEVPIHRLSSVLRKDITVVLSGEGADELFGGYGRIFRAPFIYTRDNLAEPYADFLLNRYKYVSDIDLKSVLHENVNKEWVTRGYTDSYFAGLFKEAKRMTNEDQTLYMFQHAHLLGLLHRLDTPTMAASVEGRVPFVDHELVEFVHSIPFSYKVRWQNAQSEQIAREQKLSAQEINEKYDTTKYLLRAAFKDILPAPILARKKVGFPVPLEQWFKNGFSTWAREILTDKRTRDREIFDSRALEDPLLYNGLPLRLWMMANFELFMRNYFD